jgi:osmoprotectant transport system substrate-binding protein
VVGSFNFPESVLLANIYAGALRAGGYRVSVEANAGPREIVDPALARGLVDFVPEYSGSALLFFSLGDVRAGHDTETTQQLLAQVLAPRGLVPMSPAPGQDANAIVVTAETAAKYGLRTVSDLGGAAGHLLFGGPPECPDRLLCLRGLESVYGLRFGEFAPLDTGGPLTLQALLAGEIDVGLLFTTDPGISSNHLVVLTDDRGLQPAENVTPVLRRAVIERYGTALKDLIDNVSARLTTDVVRSLDARVSLGERPTSVAADWLATQGLP